MWAGVVYDTLLERHVEYIALSGSAQIFLTVGVQCDFPVGTYLKVTYTEIRGRKLARGIWQADSFHSQETTT
jgi:hypothetical protein